MSTTPMSDTDFATFERSWVGMTEILAKEWADRGRIGEEAFFALLRNFHTIAVEIMPIRRNPETEQIEMLFLERGDDPYPEYANRLHTPGGMLVVPGSTVSSVAESIRLREIGCEWRVIARTAWGGGPTPRGSEFSIPMLVELEGEPKKGEWVLLDRIRVLAEDDLLIQAQYENFTEGAIRWIQEHPGCI